MQAKRATRAMMRVTGTAAIRSRPATRHGERSGRPGRLTWTRRGAPLPTATRRSRDFTPPSFQPRAWRKTERERQKDGRRGNHRGRRASTKNQRRRLRCADLNFTRVLYCMSLYCTSCCTVKPSSLAWPTAIRRRWPHRRSPTGCK